MQSNSESSLIQKIAYFFPIQLLLCHFKKNITIVIFWAALLGLVTGNIAVKYGIPFLFLDPEYIDKVSFWSFFIVCQNIFNGTELATEWTHSVPAQQLQYCLECLDPKYDWRITSKACSSSADLWCIHEWDSMSKTCHVCFKSGCPDN